MHIINLIDRFDTINFGVWNAAINTQTILKEKYNVQSEMWYPVKNYPKDVNIRQKEVNIKYKDPHKYLSEYNTPENTIILSHGCWQYPTKWGQKFHKKGFKWMYIPHAMLMPWCMKHKSFLKKGYFNLVEQPLAKQADIVRAVGYTEFEQLKERFTNVVHIPNGIELKPFHQKNYFSSKIQILYLARIHKVKGIDSLVQGWAKSTLKNNKNFILKIAGPDDGELATIQRIIKTHNIHNIDYLGPVYAEEKEALLKASHFFVMPSYTEGFSSSIVEAMQQGCIPLISEGCNMPHLFSKKLAIKANPSETCIQEALDLISSISVEEMRNKSDAGREYVSSTYSLEVIAEKQFEVYKTLLNA